MMGVQKMYDRMKQNYYWKNMIIDYQKVPLSLQKYVN